MTKNARSTPSPVTWDSSAATRKPSRKAPPFLPSAFASSFEADLLTSRDPTKTNELLASLGDAELAALYYDWRVWARPSQLPPPGDWRVWLLMAGRGFGKTRSGAEWVRLNIEEGRYRQVALVGPTASAVRDVMIEGESGLLGVAHPSYRPRYEIARQRLTWPNGAVAVGYSADEPDRLRGPQHDAAWCDELAAWRRPEAWDMLQFGLRLGERALSALTLLLCLGSCGTAPSDICPPVAAYDGAMMQRAAQDLAALPEDSPIVRMMEDYSVMRSQARLCTQP
jgi:phage terminase large subunit-like protein